MVSEAESGIGHKLTNASAHRVSYLYKYNLHSEGESKGTAQVEEINLCISITLT